MTHVLEIGTENPWYHKPARKQSMSYSLPERFGTKLHVTRVRNR